MNIRDHARTIHQALHAAYEVGPAFLNFRTPWELLLATVLSAQCTDERVNKVTPNVFERWPGPGELMHASQEDLEEVIRSTGFFRNKAKNLRNAARMVMEEYGGEVPRTMEDLLRLPGVARKTANIVLSQAYGIVDGIAVDTHVKRLSMRLGLTESDKPERIEKDLCEAFDKSVWGDMNHLLIKHGRTVCIARKPHCSQCMLAAECPKKGVKSAA